MCGEASIASVGMALSVIVLSVLVACAYWMMRTQTQTLEYSREQQIVATLEVLVQSSERLLARDETTAVRRLVMDTANRFELDRLRIVLPSGDVIADNDVSRITADLASAIWQKKNDTPRTIEKVAQTLAISIPMRLESLGAARLEATASLGIDPELFWESQAGVGVIGITALLALWLVYRHFRGRLAAMGVIRESLLAIEGGEQSETALAVAGYLGREATTWNQMLAERQQSRRQVAVHQAKLGMDDRRSGNSDLANGCDAMAQGVILLDEKMQVAFANNAAAVFFGVTRDEVVGSAVIDWIHDEELAAVVHDAVMNNTRASHVMDRRADGGGGVIRYTVRSMRTGDTATSLLIIEDVTQQRVAEEARHEFVTQATHELRTPLTNIRLYLETAIDDGKQDPALRSKCLNIINQETLRLEQMVSDMLCVAEIEAGSMQVARDDVRFDRLLNDIKEEYEAQAAEKDLKLEFNIPPKLPTLQADRSKLIVAVQNLVANALKYTSDGGRISISVEVHDEELLLEVADTGIGIAPEDQMHIFEKFYRAADKRISGITGSGLGLALAREIVRLHGGDIEIESQLDQGSTFTIKLPITNSDETTATE